MVRLSLCSMLSALALLVCFSLAVFATEPRSGQIAPGSGAKMTVAVPLSLGCRGDGTSLQAGEVVEIRALLVEGYSTACPLPGGVDTLLHGSLGGVWVSVQPLGGGGDGPENAMPLAALVSAEQVLAVVSPRYSIYSYGYYGYNTGYGGYSYGDDGDGGALPSYGVGSLRYYDYGQDCVAPVDVAQQVPVMDGICFGQVQQPDASGTMHFVVREPVRVADFADRLLIAGPLCPNAGERFVPLQGGGFVSVQTAARTRCSVRLWRKLALDRQRRGGCGSMWNPDYFANDPASYPVAVAVGSDWTPSSSFEYYPRTPVEPAQQRDPSYDSSYSSWPASWRYY